MTNDPEKRPKRRSRRHWTIVAAVLGVVMLLVAGEFIRRDARRRWLTSEIIAAGGSFQDHWQDQSWRIKVQYWFRMGEYPRLRMLHFTRTIDPEWLREHDYLRGLDVTVLTYRDRGITGDDLAQLIEGQPLDSLYLIDEHLSPRTFTAIADKRGWKVLQFSGCNLTDDDLARFDLSRIESLAVDSTGVTSDGLSVLTRCERLEKAMFGGRQVSPQIASQLAALGTLKYLHLVGKQVTDADLDPVVAITSLEMLHLVNTSTTQQGLDKLAKATAGRSLIIR